MSKEVIRPIYNVLLPPAGVPSPVFYFILLGVFPFLWLLKATNILEPTYYEHPDGSIKRYPPKY